MIADRERMKDEQARFFEARWKQQQQSRQLVWWVLGTPLGLIAGTWLFGLALMQSGAVPRDARARSRDCVQIWQLRLAQSGYTRAEAEIGAVRQCSSEIRTVAEKDRPNPPAPATPGDLRD
jgi:hypothetical protein